MNISLSGKTALVCGSTQGIGLACAIEFAASGADCVLMARNESALQEALQQLDTSAGQQHTYLVADFSNVETVRDAITNYVATKDIHILLNNTGGPKAGPIINAAEEDFAAAFSQHILCNQVLTKAVVPGMQKAAYGRIINIVSTSVRIPIPNLGVSNTIRGAVASWAKTMANELGRYNITVNNILPGLTKTKRLESLAENTAANKQAPIDSVYEELRYSIPMQRFGEPDEIAAVAAFLASPAASYVNGTSIPVDGGRTGSI